MSNPWSVHMMIWRRAQQSSIHITLQIMNAKEGKNLRTPEQIVVHLQFHREKVAEVERRSCDHVEGKIIGWYSSSTRRSNIHRGRGLPCIRRNRWWRRRRRAIRGRPRERRVARAVRSTISSTMWGAMSNAIVSAVWHAVGSAIRSTVERTIGGRIMRVWRRCVGRQRAIVVVQRRRSGRCRSRPG